MNPSSKSKLEKLAPFLLRARAVVRGREKLIRMQNQLAFLLVSPDLSDNSLQEMFPRFSCPKYLFSQENFEKLLAMSGTKIAGVVRGPLADAIQPELTPFERSEGVKE